jgi:LGFP repeat
MVILQSRKTILVAAFLLLMVTVNSLFLTVSPVSATAKDMINGIDVGSPTDDVHYWGNCQVQDFNGGTYGWVIVSNGYNAPSNQYPLIYTFQTTVVRNGMLFGWFDQGGATGSLGCPTSDEYPYMNGERQDFQGGSLYWLPGMNHAALIDPNREGALVWAWSYEGQTVWVGQCLWFAVHAYMYGQNWTLQGPYGDDVRAVDWWNEAPSPQISGDMNPPRGALVFWDYWAGGTGHAALSLGGGWVISTEFGGDYSVHVFKISDFPDHYLGWKDPS